MSKLLVESAVVQSLVLEALKEVQVLGGHEWRPFSPKADIIGTLEGFDSLTGIEATVLVERKLAARLGRPDLSLGRDSIFVSDDGRKALDTNDVVAKVCLLLEAA
jgi:hypothetical protein